MGELRGVSIFSSVPRACACLSDAKYAKTLEDMGCCHSEQEFLHLEDDLQCKIFQTNLDTQVFPNFSQHFEYIFLKNPFSSPIVGFSFNLDYGPPPQSLYLWTHSFLLYD